MKNREEIKRRFLKDSVAVRLGGIASNLARLHSFSKTKHNKKVVCNLIEESKFFIEWTTPETDLEIQEELVNLQVKLALWNFSIKQKDMTKETEKWSNKVLQFSGLAEGD